MSGTITFSPPASTSDGSALQASSRVASIDILRALTMILMIFVNDLWSLKNIPEWLEHAAPGVDGMGLADTVFPAFLFIVGMSLPFAISNRRRKGQTDMQLIRHVVIRAFALLVMGVFLVNGETYNAEATGMARYFYNPIVCFSFILIWNTYPKSLNKNLVNGLKVLGVIVLIFMAVIYRGGENGNVERFAPHWWGILGLIGWAYLVSGIVTVLSKNNFWIVLGSWIFFAVLSMLYKADIVPHHGLLAIIPGAILGGTITGFTIGGVLTSLIFQYFRNKKDNKTMTITLILIAVFLIVLSVIVRPYWGLAKLGATPAWLFLCSAYTILTFIVIYWIADVWGKVNAFNIIKPAGTDTLLTYLIPYFAYFATRLVGFHLPEILLVGGLGLIKSFLFAMLCVFITGGLGRLGIHLKL